MGWHLRFAKTDRVEALVTLTTIEQVRQQMYIYNDWSFDFVEESDHWVAHMTRLKPLYDTEENA